MSRLEDFINENREAFDDELPSEKVWKGLEAGIPVTQAKIIKLTPLLKWGIAASLLLVTATVAFFIVHKPVNTGVTAAANIDTSTDIAAIAPEAAPEVNQFAKLIALKQEELKTLAKEQPELYQKFTTDITQLDSSYRDLKNQLNIAPNKEMPIEAMVKNLQLQLNVLNQQLNIIDQIKQKKNGHDKDKNFM